MNIHYKLPRQWQASDHFCRVEKDICLVTLLYLMCLTKQLSSLANDHTTTAVCSSFLKMIWDVGLKLHLKDSEESTAMGSEPSPSFPCASHGHTSFSQVILYRVYWVKCLLPTKTDALSSPARFHMVEGQQFPQVVLWCPKHAWHRCVPHAQIR